MNVVEHRPPRKRIETALKPRAIELECISPGSLALRELGARIEQDRIWGLLKQSAEGCNAPTGEGRE
jgi:hypothetical protein